MDVTHVEETVTTTHETDVSDAEHPVSTETITRTLDAPAPEERDTWLAPVAELQRQQQETGAQLGALVSGLAELRGALGTLTETVAGLVARPPEPEEAPEPEEEPRVPEEQVPEEQPGSGAPELIVETAPPSEAGRQQSRPRRRLERRRLALPRL